MLLQAHIFLLLIGACLWMMTIRHLKEAELLELGALWDRRTSPSQVRWGERSKNPKLEPSGYGLSFVSTIHSSRGLRSSNAQKDVPGMIAGFIGLISLIIRNWGAHPKLHIITYVFAGVFGFIILLSTFTFFIGIGEGLAATFGITLITFAALAALYGDWALGAMTNNLWGFPSQDSFGLYVSYLILKRLTMFSL